MNIRKEFTKSECDFFRQECNFTDEEQAVFDIRVKGASIVEISQKLNISTATVNRRIRDIKRKILKVI